MANPFLKVAINWRDILGFALSAGLLWLTWHQSDIAEEGLHIKGGAWAWLFCAMGAFLVSVALHCWRCWQVWRSRSGVSATLEITSTGLFIGNFFNVVLPGNVGELVRAWHFHRRTGANFWRSTAGILTEKFVDAQIYLTVLIPVIFWWRSSWKEPVFLTLYLVGIGLLVANVVIAVMYKYSSVERMVLGLVPARQLRKILFRTFRYLLSHLQFLVAQKRMVGYSIAGYILLGLNMLQYYFVLKASGVQTELISMSTVFLMAVVMVVVNVTPSAPGSAGVVHYGIFATLMLVAKLLELPIQGAAFAMAGVYLHLSYFIPETIIGAWLVWRERRLLTQWKQPN